MQRAVPRSRDISLLGRVSAGFAEILTEEARVEGGTQLALHPAEDDGLLHAPVSLDGHLLDDDGRSGLRFRARGRARNQDDRAENEEPRSPPCRHRALRVAWGLLVLGKLKRGLGRLGFAEHEIRTFDVDVDSRALGDLAPDDRLRQRILDVLLDRPP